MKTMTALFILVIAVLLTGCASKTTLVQASEKKLKIGESYRVALVRSPIGCTLSPRAWTEESRDHAVTLIGFGVDREVALVKVMYGTSAETEVCKPDEVVHVPSRMLALYYPDPAKERK